jgi:excisionase family DNA binding protein
MAPATAEPTALDEDQAQTAADAARTLHSLLQTANGSVHLKTPEGEEVLVPTAAFRLFVDVLTILAGGDGVVVLPEHAELSTQQAADMLNVSRPFVVRLIEEHKLPARKVGGHRRILLSDLLAYKRQDEAEREQVMRDLARESQALGLEY